LGRCSITLVATRKLVTIVLLASCGEAPPAVTSVAPRACEGSVVRDPHDRWSFCTPYNAWVSTMHAVDEREGPFDYTYYALRAGTTFAVTVHERANRPTAFPKDARVATDRATFHGREVEHQTASFHLHSDAQDELLDTGRHEFHAAEDHDVTFERWWVAEGEGSILVAARAQDDTTPEARRQLAEVIGSFRWGR
jgi:hypothetical protein